MALLVFSVLCATFLPDTSGHILQPSPTDNVFQYNMSGFAIIISFFTILFSIVAYFLWQTYRKIAFQYWVYNYKERKAQPVASSENKGTDFLRPPTVKGHFFWGNALEFHKNAARFLQRVANEYGEVATIRLINRKIVVVNDIHSLSMFCHEPKFDFRPVINQVCNNVFGFSVISRAVDEHRKRLVYFYRSVKVSDTVTLFDSHLSRSLNEHEPKGTNVNVHDFVIKTGFLAIFQTLLGTSSATADLQSLTKEMVSEQRENEAALFYSHYTTFAKYFNYLWLGFSLKLFPPAWSAFNTMIKLHPPLAEVATRTDVCPYLFAACQLMQKNGNSTEDILRHCVELVHVHSNIVRLAYWMIVFTLSDEKAAKALVDEIDELVAQKQAVQDRRDAKQEQTLFFEIDEIENIQSLGSVFKETLRLVSGVVVLRAVTQDALFKVDSGKIFELKRGETVLFYPPAHHRDPEIFTNPDKFAWDRFFSTTFYKNGKAIEKPVMGFGSLCVGQRFATLLAKWYVVQAFHRWHMHLTGPVPSVDDSYQCHEVLPPIGDTTFDYQPRSGAVNLRIIGQTSPSS